MIKLEARRLAVFYGAKQALHGVDLAIEENEVLALIGPSGCVTDVAKVAANHAEHQDHIDYDQSSTDAQEQREQKPEIERASQTSGPAGNLRLHVFAGSGWQRS